MDTQQINAFAEFPKMARFSREFVITEKIDGTNAQILIEQDGTFLVGSRTKWITPKDDNYGFANWAHANKEELLKLGPGRHFGEWWGSGIQRNYGMKKKVFSLFNTSRWVLPGQPKSDKQDYAPSCCSVVPVICVGNFDEINLAVEKSLDWLKKNGSFAAPGFMKPEGIVVWHTAGNFGMKKTIEKDETPKSLQ